MKPLIAILIGLGIGIATWLATKTHTKRQLDDLRHRHQEAADALRAAIEQRRFVAANLIDALSDNFYGEAQLQRIIDAESRVKDLIFGQNKIEDLARSQHELNDSVQNILPLLSADSHVHGNLVNACVQGWNETAGPIEHTTLTYNDAVVTWNEFLQSRRVRLLGRSWKTQPLSCVDWDTGSSDPGGVKPKTHAPA